MVSETRPFAQGKRCCFTLFNPNGFRPDFAQDNNDVAYAVYQLEFAPSTGTPHYQGVIFFLRHVKANYVNRTYFDNRASLTRCDKAQASIEYCTREFNDDGTPKRAPLSDDLTDAGPWDYGNKELVVESGSNKRKKVDIPSTVDDLITAVSSGEVDVLEYGRYKQFVNDRQMHSLERRHYTKFLCLWGPTETGKTTLIQHLFPNYYDCTKEEGGARGTGKLWWDGYEPSRYEHRTVVIDDFHHTISITQFKELVNQTPYRVAKKGTRVPFVADLLIILSNFNPRSEWWPNQRGTENYAAAMRRMDPPLGKIIHVTCPLVKKEIVNDSTPQGYHYKITFLPGAHALADQIRQFIEFDLSATEFAEVPTALRPIRSRLPRPEQVEDTTEEEVHTPPRQLETEPSVHVSDSPSSIQPEPPTVERLTRSKRRKINLPDSRYSVFNASRFNVETNRLEFE